MYKKKMKILLLLSNSEVIKKTDGLIDKKK